MAQTGYTPILIYSSSTAAAAPSASNLTNSTLGSELAINITDGKLFYKDNANAVQVIGWKTVPTTAGGTGLTSYTAGDLIYYAAGTALTKLAIGASGRWLGSSGTAPQWNAPAALTKTDDTNVTLTLGGSASTALLNSASLTLGWTGTLAVSRGGTGTGTTFTTGSVIFAGASGVYSQDNAEFFWDDTNNKLGIGTATPNTFPGKLVVIGDGTVCDREFNSRVSSSLADGERGFFQVVDGTTEFQIYTPNGGGCVTNIRGTEAMRVHTSRGVSIGNTTDPGASNLSVTGSIAFANVSNGIGKTGTFTRNSGTASGNVAYTGVGFKPSIVVFYAGIDTTRDFMIGAGTASAGRALYDNFENTLGVNNQAVPFYYRRDVGAGNFDIQSATIASMDSDGFTLTYTRTRGGAGTANDIIVNYVAYK
jgi:hypothetical protein